jgi:hypothetical protein
MTFLSELRLAIKDVLLKYTDNPEHYLRMVKRNKHGNGDYQLDFIVALSKESGASINTILSDLMPVLPEYFNATYRNYK